MWRALLFALVALIAADRFEELKTQLSSSDARMRREAVVELAKFKSLDGWKLVIGALKDTNSQVADEAQMQVAGIVDVASMKELLGKEGLGSKDDWVRLRVAEALGRMESPPARQVFNEVLDDKNSEVRRTLAWSIERLVRAGSSGHLKPYTAMIPALKVEKDAGVRAAGFVALAQLSKEQPTTSSETLSTGIPVLIDAALSDKAFEVRSAGVIIARELEADGAFAQVRPVAIDAQLGVRLNAAEFFTSSKNKRGALALVDMLEAEKNLRARWRIVELLRGLSGLAYRLDVRPWREWVLTLSDDWHGEAKPAPKFDDGDKTVTFAGLPILSERVCFLIDLSGSVWQKNKDGKTRKSVIDDELKKALEALPATTEFNLIPYTAAPIPWQPGLVAADKKNVAKALDFFTSRKDTGTGNFWDAWLVALDDPKVDTIVMLSDGAPSGGHRWNLTLMRQLMAEHNRFRRVALDAVLADAKGRIVEEWRGMCADSGGHLVEVDLR